MRVHDTLTRRGLRLEYATLGWNVIGVPILVIAAIRSGSAAAAGFGLDSAIEIGASLVVNAARMRENVERYGEKGLDATACDTATGELLEALAPYLP